MFDSYLNKWKLYFNISSSSKIKDFLFNLLIEGVFYLLLILLIVIFKEISIYFKVLFYMYFVFSFIGNINLIIRVIKTIVKNKK